MLNYLKRFEIGIELVSTITLIILSNIVLSCDRQQETKTVMVAKNINNSSVLNISDYATDIEYIKLETADHILLTGGEQIAVTSENIITFGKECLVFSRNGAFKKKISNLGKGPGEYLSARNAYMFPENKLIYFPSTAYDKINVYSLENELIYQCERSQTFLYLRNVNQELFAGYRAFQQGDAEWNLLLHDCNGDSISYMPNYYPYDGVSRMVFSEEGLFYYLDNQLHFKEAYSDTIYIFNTEGKERPKYVLDLGNYSVTPEVRKDGQTFMNLFFDNLFAISGLFESDNYLIFKYHYNRNQNMMIYCKSTSSIENFTSGKNSAGIPNDLDNGLNFFPTYNDNNEFFQLINAYDLIAHVATEEFKNSSPEYPEKKKELEVLAASLDESDNPVLMLIKLEK